LNVEVRHSALFIQLMRQREAIQNFFIRNSVFDSHVDRRFSAR
jgi:hypothetical protein